MRKKFSIICAIMIILVGMIGLSACGGSEDGGNTEKVRQTESVGFVKYAKPEGLEEIESSDGYCYYMGGDLSLEISTAVSNYSSLDEFVTDKRARDSFMTASYDKSMLVDGVLSVMKHDTLDRSNVEIEVISYVEGNEAAFKFTLVSDVVDAGDLVVCDQYINDFLGNVSFNWKMLGLDEPEHINRYEEGFTLEEAKASTAEFGNIFIKKGEKYYPTLRADYTKLSGKSNSHYLYDKIRVFLVDESNGEKPIGKLTEGDKLVDVVGEEPYEKVHFLNGDSGYTVPIYPGLDYGNRDTKKPMWGATSYGYCVINELIEVNGIELEAVSEYNTDDRESILNSEIEGLVLLWADPYHQENSYLINASEKGEEVTCGYFVGTEYKEVKMKANLKSYNLPTNINSKAVWKDVTQSKSKEGYIEYDISKLENGLYALDNYIFEVIK